MIITAVKECAMKRCIQVTSSELRDGDKATAKKLQISLKGALMQTWKFPF